MLDIVLGVAMAPKTIRMVLVEGESADGVTVDEDRFGIEDADGPATLSTEDQVIAAILGTREGASQGGHQLTSTGVTWTDPSDAAALATALAARKVENVMLVSAFLAAAALAQTVGQAIGYDRIAMLFVEQDTATLAVVDSTDGSVTEVHRRPLRNAYPVPELVAMIGGLDAPETPAQGLFIVGCDVDIAPIKPALEAASYLPVSAPEEPDMALARGAALASAKAPLFASSTAALAYAKDPGTGEVDAYAVSPGYLDQLAYSGAPDDDADARTGFVETGAQDDFETSPRRHPLMLVGSAVAVVVVSAALALEIALALGIRPAVALRPTPGQALIAPVRVTPTPPVPPLLSVPHPAAIRPPPLHMPAPAPIALPAPAPVPIPVAPVPPVRLPLDPPRMNLALPRLRVPSQPPLVRQPVPQMHMPSPPSRRQIPQPPRNFPPPQGRRYPQGPQFGQGPRFSQGPRFQQGPQFRQGPRFPTMPGPRFPRMPGPMMPRMPGLPHFPSFRF